MWVYQAITGFQSQRPAQARPVILTLPSLSKCIQPSTSPTQISVQWWPLMIRQGLIFSRIEANEKLKVTYIRPGRSGHLHNSFLSCNSEQDSERCIWLLDWFVWGFYFKILFKSYMYLYEYLLGNVFVWVQVPSWVQEASNPLELLLQVTNHPHWALETKLRSFRNRVYAYNCWAISLVLAFFGKASK